MSTLRGKCEIAESSRGGISGHSGGTQDTSIAWWRKLTPWIYKAPVNAYVDKDSVGLESLEVIPHPQNAGRRPWWGRNRCTAGFTSTKYEWRMEGELLLGAS